MWSMCLETAGSLLKFLPIFERLINTVQYVMNAPATESALITTTAFCIWTKRPAAYPNPVKPKNSADMGKALTLCLVRVVVRNVKIILISTFKPELHNLYHQS